MIDKFMVFDVESIGLHGEGFAVGWIVIDKSGNTLDEGYLACDPTICCGTKDDHLWVSENVPVLHYSHTNIITLRSEFWRLWRYWADQGVGLVADCAWPVEARFLIAAVNDDRATREREGPYPLHDLASVLLAIG